MANGCRGFERGGRAVRLRPVAPQAIGAQGAFESRCTGAPASNDFESSTLQRKCFGSEGGLDSELALGEAGAVVPPRARDQPRSTSLHNSSSRNGRPSRLKRWCGIVVLGARPPFAAGCAPPRTWAPPRVWARAAWLTPPRPVAAGGPGRPSRLASFRPGSHLPRRRLNRIQPRVHAKSPARRPPIRSRHPLSPTPQHTGGSRAAPRTQFPIEPQASDAASRQLPRTPSRLLHVTSRGRVTTPLERRPGRCSLGSAAPLDVPLAPNRPRLLHFVAAVSRRGWLLGSYAPTLASLRRPKSGLSMQSPEH